MLIRKVKVQFANAILPAELLIDDQEITLLYNERISITKKGEYPFFVLKEIREELEKLNQFLLINGSRKDVYISGMTLPGHMAYVQVMNKPTSRSSLVNIFDETDRLDLIGTVEDQKKYHDAWINSILGE